jgi:predicted ribosomally synthesized peptide with nif11-like leader
MGKFVDFYVKVMETPELKAKVAAIIAGGTGDAAIEKLIALAKENGFEFTKQEVVDYFKTNFSGDGGELSDADLEAVAGGKGGRIPKYSDEEFGKSLVSIGGALF